MAVESKTPLDFAVAKRNRRNLRLTAIQQSAAFAELHFGPVSSLDMDFPAVL